MTETNKDNLLDQEAILQIKKDLLKKREELLVELKKISNVNYSGNNNNGRVKFPEYGDKEDENAQEVADYTTNKPLEETLEKLLRDVNKSLTTLKAGNYGVCKYCDKPIDEKRLLARPMSSACVSCKKTLTDEV